MAKLSTIDVNMTEQMTNVNTPSSIVENRRQTDVSNRDVIADAVLS